MFGSRRNYAFMRSIALLMEAIWNPDRSDSVDWIDDPYSFDQVVRATNAALEAIRPPEPVPEPRLLSDYGQAQGQLKAASLFAATKSADPAADLATSSEQERLLTRIQEDLAGATDRVRIVTGTAEDFRRMAGEMEQAKRDHEDDSEGKS